MPFLIIALATAVVIVAFDAAAALAARRMGFNYTLATIGSVLIYATSGFFAARTGGVDATVKLGAIAALTDATLGWRVSWLIGPGRLPGGKLTPNEWASSAAFLVVLAVACAWAGGWVAGRV